VREPWVALSNVLSCNYTQISLTPKYCRPLFDLPWAPSCRTSFCFVAVVVSRLVIWWLLQYRRTDYGKCCWGCSLIITWPSNGSIRAQGFGWNPKPRSLNPFTVHIFTCIHIHARNITTGPRSSQWIGQMSDLSLRLFSKNDRATHHTIHNNTNKSIGNWQPSSTWIYS
jgi:hypothetical protein